MSEILSFLHMVFIEEPLTHGNFSFWILVVGVWQLWAMLRKRKDG